MRRAILLVLAVGLSSSPIIGKQASPSGWQRQEKSDPLHEVNYTEFRLEGKYLIPPKGSHPLRPFLVARCKAGVHKYRGTGGVANGEFLEGYLVVDAVLDFHEGRVPVEFRLDDGKLRQTAWASSTNGAGAFFTSADFNNLLYGHLLPHKESTGGAIRKVILGVPEYLGGEIEAAFEMPEPGDVADVCGVIAHK